MKQLPTKAACDIVQMNRQRLNEDIASGAYPCAPPAHDRTGRFWDENDLCALRVYSFLLTVYGAEGTNHKPAISKRVAGMYAQGVLSALRSGSAEAARLDFPINGFNDEWVANEDNAPPSFTAPSGSVSEVATICFSLDGIRAQIRTRLAQWAGEA